MNTVASLPARLISAADECAKDAPLLREAATALLSEHGGGGEADDKEKWGQQFRCGCFLGYPTKRAIPHFCPQHSRGRQGSALPLGAASTFTTPPTPSAPVVDDARAVFEKWVAKRHGCALDRWADSGKYRYDNTNAWWECWNAALSGVSAPVEAEEAAHLRTIDQRDVAYDALGRMFYAATGRHADWSSAWGFAEAIVEVEEHVATLSQQPAAPSVECNCASGCGVEHCVVHAPNDALPKFMNACTPSVSPAMEGGLPSDEDQAFASTLDKQAELAKIKKDEYGHYFLSEAAKRIRRLASPAPSEEPTCHAREIAALRKLFPNASTSELVDAIFAVKNAFNKEQP